MLEKLTMTGGIQQSVGPRRPLVRPISHVALVLSDKNAFNVAIRETVSWMNGKHRCEGAIPKEALTGTPFDLTHDLAAIPAAAAHFQDSNQRVWAAKLDFPDRTTAQRTWSTEISITQQGQTTRFAARLTNVTRGEGSPFTPSIPGVVRGILGKLSAEADEFPISDEAFIVDDNSQADFEHLLLDRRRRLPILAFSEFENGRCILDPRIAAQKLAGTAHIVRLKRNASWQLTKTYGRRYSVFDGAARLYWAPFDPDEDDQYRHPLHKPLPNEDTSDFLAWVNARILPTTFLKLNKTNDIVRLVDVQALASRRDRAATADGDEARRLQQAVASLEASLVASERQRSEDGDAAQALLDEAAADLQVAEQQRDEIAAENDRLRAKLQVLSQATAREITHLDRRLESYDDFETWADNTLGQHVHVSAKAIRETEKHGQPEIIGKLQETLTLIRDFYVPMRRGTGTVTWDTFREKCEEIGVEERACFAQKNDIKSFPGYSTQLGSRKVWLDRHFKYGGGYDPRRMFRIYFSWDDDTQSVVIGHMPTHLDNNNTD